MTGSRFRRQKLGMAYTAPSDRQSEGASATEPDHTAFRVYPVQIGSFESMQELAAEDKNRVNRTVDDDLGPEQWRQLRGTRSLYGKRERTPYA